MRFIIIGAGGIGCYYGARLQQAGHEVLLVARGEHLTAMQTTGLQVQHPDFTFNEPVNSCTQEQLQSKQAAEDADLIILTIKASHTKLLLQDLQEWLQAAQTPVLSLQNGVDNEILIAQCIGRERTLGGLAVRIGGHVVKPGVIEATGRGEVIMGEWPHAMSPDSQEPSLAEQSLLSEFTDVFNHAGIPTQLTHRIQHELWLKLLINNGVNPLSALTGLDTKALTSHPVYGDIVFRLMQETVSVAVADGVHVTQQELEEKYQLICQFDAIKTSMLIDREKGRPLETDAISGAVLRRSEALDIPTPLTALINSLLQPS